MTAKTGVKIRDERGLVSFTITIIMMLVISLIVVGFTQVTNNNRREQLDRQLSMQAFYAAESGVNAVVDDISTALASGGTVTKQDTCDGTYSPQRLATDGSVAYTCVFVNPIVSEITTSANQTTSQVIPLNFVSGGNGNNYNTGNQLDISFTWDSIIGASTNTANCGTLGTFDATASYDCGWPILRVDIMNVRSAAILTASGLAADTSSFYMQPVASGPTSPVLTDFNTKGYVMGATCSAATKTCRGTISMRQNAKTTNYYARITSLYGDTEKVTIDGVNSIGEDAYFKGAQAKIDVTGRAQDVLRRVQVTVPLENYDGSLIEEGAIKSSVDVCKRFSVYNGYYGDNSSGC